jgi:3-oxoacyl-[acyl-carrier protein] reductase
MLGEAFPGLQAPLKDSEMAEFVYDFALNGKKYFNGKTIPVALSTP